MEATPSPDPIWVDLAAIAFELFAKPHDPARDAGQCDGEDAEKEERER